MSDLLKYPNYGNFMRPIWFGIYSCKMSSIGLALNVDGQQNINKF